MIWFLAIAISVQVPPDTSGAYLDARAREIVQLARARRLVVDRSITRYQATVKERISVGLRTRLRDMLVWRRETASRIDWKEGGPIEITVLGAREVVPVATPKVVIPNDLQNFLPRLAFDPLDFNQAVRVDTTGLLHPLADGAEAKYRYRTGGTTTISLGDRVIELIELQVTPRQNDVRLITGSYWIDAASHSIVQAVFRPSERLEMVVSDKDEPGVNKFPGLLKPAGLKVDYITIEYGLMHLRWWLPTLLAAEGTFQVGPVRTPVTYERSYSGYEVEGDTTMALVARSVGDSMRRCQPRTEMNINVDLGEKRTPEQIARDRVRNDSIRAAALARDTARARRAREQDECSKRYRVIIADSTTLLTSTELPGSIYGDNDRLTTDPELARLASRLKRLSEAPAQLERLSTAWGLGASGLVRYNKVEALSIATRTDLDYGKVQLDGTARIGIADLEPNFEAGLTRNTRGYDLRVAGYRRLDVMDAQSGMGGFSASLAALFLGRDERDYFRTLGGEVRLRPGDASAQWFNLRLFGEAQKATSNKTDFSLPNAIGGDAGFPSNLRADRADQMGIGLALRKSIGLNPARPRLNAELSSDASNGTFDFTRHTATVQLSTPLLFNLAGAIEASAGTTTGAVPTQSLFFLGGVRSMRGYPIGELAGNAFWRGRAELGTELPLIRPVVFSDLGWAGDRDNIARRASMLSVGGGVSFLDGVVRMDLARALRGNTGWKFSLSVGALF